MFYDISQTRRELESFDHYTIIQNQLNSTQWHESLYESLPEYQKQEGKHESLAYKQLVLEDIRHRDDLFGNIKNSLNKTVF